MLQVGVY